MDPLQILDPQNPFFACFLDVQNLNVQNLNVQKLEAENQPGLCLSLQILDAQKLEVENRMPLLRFA